MISKLLIFICLLSCLSFSKSCSCIPPDYSTAEGLIQYSDEVFSGKILKIIPGPDINAQIKIKIRVRKVFMTNKNLKCGDKIWITTCGNSACCGYYFIKGKNYLLYLNNRSASLCSPTKLLKDASTDLALLKDYFD